jgi:hypothetical protein
MKQKKYKVKEENVKKLEIYLSKIDGGKENK